jgi:(p)ppGpp synthase/HD superfamily hydrolase
MLTDRLARALALAVKAHHGQVRKATNIPYVAHPMAVASIALEYGADEDQAIAALLHDVLEDGGAHYAHEIETQFGGRVLAIVQGCTDGVPDETGQKPGWQQRKEAYLVHLRGAHDDVLLVSGSDKLHNARAIMSDLQSCGAAVFDRFTAGKQGTLWYYSSLSDVFLSRKAPMAESLSALVKQMHVAAQS